MSGFPNHIKRNKNTKQILEIKAKINKWDLIKIKSFCTTKENISKVNRNEIKEEFE